MDQELLKKLKPHVLKNLLPLVLGSLGLIFLSYGLIGSIASGSLLGGQAKDDVELVQYSKEESAQDVSVDISGEVISPGVYTLSSSSRIKDALAKAGGVSANADREWVAKNLNLAKKVQDGIKIYIPGINEKNSKSSESRKSSNESSLQSSVNINTGSESELDSLPGIGPVTAEKIIENRPYSSVEELLDKKIVGSSVFEKIKSNITY